MFDFIAKVLATFYELPVVGGNYGFAIIMLTVAVMVLLMPLTLKATRSTIKMQQVQPQLKRIQKDNADDREAMNAELMALYKENGINPIGGCLPMVAQLPVFLVLFQVLRGLTRRVSETSFFNAANLVRQEVGLDALEGQTFDPKFVGQDTQIYQDLSTSTTMRFGPFDLAAKAIDVAKDNFLQGIPYVLMIIFLVGTSYYQQRQVSARRGSDSGPMNQQQQMLLRFLPLLSGVWSFVFPAGLVVYWATSNIIRIGQQAYITRQIYHKEGGSEKLELARKEAKEIADKDKKKSNSKDSDKKNDSKKKTANQSKMDDAANSKSSADKTKAEAKAEEWEARARQKKVKKSSKPGISSRTSPKGTSPNQKKKKRRK